MILSENLSACRAHGCRPRNIYFLRRTWRRRKGWAFLSPRPLRGATAEWRDLDTVATISIHAPLAGCDRAGAPPGSNRTDFNPRTPCGVRHFWSIVRSISLTISIHAPLAGCDVRRTLCLYLKDSPFQSTHPLRGATVLLRISILPKRLFQSTHPLRGATIKGKAGGKARIISIHAPLAGRDLTMAKFRLSTGHFNPRAPCGARHIALPCKGNRPLISIHAPLAGRDLFSSSFCRSTFGFQSTRPLRGATLIAHIIRAAKQHFNPRAPCGARRDPFVCRCPPRPHFNPRAPCGARLYCSPSVDHTHPNFNPRAPCGARLVPTTAKFRLSMISIHAPLAGRDHDCPAVRRVPKYFNPRAPCGARLLCVVRVKADRYFNPRAPCGARLGIGQTLRATAISIHAPLAGRDFQPSCEMK